MTATVQDRQSIADVALQYFGSIEAVFTVADRLGIAATDTPSAGTTFDYQPAEVLDPHVVDYYADCGIVPTTALDQQPQK